MGLLYSIFQCEHAALPVSVGGVEGPCVLFDISHDQYSTRAVINDLLVKL